MNIVITNFNNPFSFFCLMEEIADNIDMKFSGSNERVCTKTIDSINVNHGQYIAVMWKNKWVRGIVTMQSQFLVWLVDFGIYLRPNEDMVYMDLPREYKKYPTHVFEASIHGVMPIDKVLNSECQIENSLSTTWNKGSIDRVLELIKTCKTTLFVPLAILSTKYNDVVIGDLYFQIKGCFVNIIDELEKWPIFAERKGNVYIENLQTFYTSHRRHRASSLKPELPKKTLPNITLDVTYDRYNSICNNGADNIPSTVRSPPCLPSREYEVSSDSDQSSVDGATIVTLSMNICDKGYKLSSAEIEKYAKMSVIVDGVEHNALQLLLNKIKDFQMCDHCKNLKSVGRASSRRGNRLWDIRNAK